MSTRQSEENERHIKKNPNMRKESVEVGWWVLMSLIFQVVLPMLRSFQGFVVPAASSADHLNLVPSEPRKLNLVF